ncbi:GntR family transcriptional regulator [Aquibium carbonis]|uniref:GntR family transcriptional regulator n=1 Tax=Aquibium carbonis TaxID=2495581 RepID=A0A429YSE9_9HYPH|nr:GntR family transcriptional regulator [Aquibium carbonis]RST84361.1 GntR family transcriptional regulator [Aquibium carbonis]
MPRLKHVPLGFDLAEALAGVRIDRAQPIAPQIYRALRQRIVDGRLPAGTPIHENDIAALCLVSRTPLRAAMQQLANEGLVVTRPQVGSAVAGRDRARFLEALFVRTAIESQIARRLAKTGLDEAALAPVLSRQEDAARRDDYATFFDVDEEFHELLATMARVPGAWHLVQSVKAHVDRERYMLMSSIRGRSARAFGDHLAVLAAIRAGDGDAAAGLMTGHIESVLDESFDRAEGPLD